MVDWSLWLNLQKVQIWQAVALSLGRDPDRMQEVPLDARAVRNEGAYEAEDCCFENQEEHQEFGRRLRICASKFGGRAQWHRDLVELAQVVSLAQQIGWELPPELGMTHAAGIAVSAALPAPTGPWPWGKHETKLLRELEAAARRFWLNYDPSDQTTAPKSEQVVSWLECRGVSKRSAEAIATLLRADGLPLGPRT